MRAVFDREGDLAEEMAGLLVDAQESGNAATATNKVHMFCAHPSAYLTRSRSKQNQHVPMSAALDAPASWLVRRPGLLRCCSWAAKPLVGRAGWEPARLSDEGPGEQEVEDERVAT